MVKHDDEKPEITIHPLVKGFLILWVIVAMTSLIASVL
jgi:hypothetical protein